MLGEGIREKYEDALRKIELLMQDNNGLKSNNNNLNLEIQQLLAKFSAAESVKER